MIDPYASHLPILKALGQHLPLRRVLEFGAGRYSTLAFIDPAIYPSAIEVISVEDDGDWLMMVQTLVVTAGRDGMWKPIYTPRPMTELISASELAGFDLIFIDNGRHAGERVPVIAAVAAAQPNALVVIHDFEVPEYQQAAASFEHRHIYTLSVPWTAVLWFGQHPEMEAFLENLPSA